MGINNGKRSINGSQALALDQARDALASRLFKVGTLNRPLLHFTLESSNDKK